MEGLSLVPVVLSLKVLVEDSGERLWGSFGEGMFRRHFGTTFRWKVLGKLGQVWQNFGQTDVALDASCIFWRRLGL